MTATNHKIDGPPGFFLATHLSDAEFFAIRRTPGTVLRFEISSNAIEKLRIAGAVQRPIPRGRNSPFFAGDELHVPTSAFGVFNQLRRNGEIAVILEYNSWLNP